MVWIPIDATVRRDTSHAGRDMYLLANPRAIGKPRHWPLPA